MTALNPVIPERDNQGVKHSVSALENSLHALTSYTVKFSAVIIGFYFIIDAVKYAREIYSSAFSQVFQLSDSKFIPTIVTAISVIITLPLVITACRIFLYPLAIFWRRDLDIKSVLLLNSLIILGGIAIYQALFPFFNMIILVVALKLLSL